MENNEKAEIIINSIPEEDAYIVLAIIEKTIEVMDIKTQISQEEFASLSEHERYIERITPRIEKIKLNDKLSTIFIRFIGDETPIAEALFTQSKPSGLFLIPPGIISTRRDLT